MRESIIFFFFTILMSCQAPVYSQTVLFERNVNHAAERAVCEHSNDFSETEVVKLSKEFERLHKNNRFLHLMIFLDPCVPGDWQFGKGQYHVTFEQWTEGFANEAKTPRPIAEMVRIGQDATLRIHRANGKVTQIVLQGKDVFHQQNGNEHFNLLYLTLQSKSQTVSFYLRSSSETLGKESAQDMVRKLANGQRLPRLSVTFRRDGWFASDPAYPWFNPFNPETAPPSWAQYAAAAEIFCMADGKIVCDDKAGQIPRGAANPPVSSR
jgi:hypothetical protein